MIRSSTTKSLHSGRSWSLITLGCRDSPGVRKLQAVSSQASGLRNPRHIRWCIILRLCINRFFSAWVRVSSMPPTMSSQKRQLTTSSSSSRLRKRRKNSCIEYIIKDPEDVPAVKETHIEAYGHYSSIPASRSKDGKYKRARVVRRIIVIREDRFRK